MRQNHLGTVQGGALFTVGDVAAARAALAVIGPATAKLHAVTARAENHYLKPARGSITADATLAGDHALSMNALEREQRAMLTTAARLSEHANNTVAGMSLDWHVQHRRDTATTSARSNTQSDVR